MRRRHIPTTLGASLATGFVDPAQSPQAHLAAGGEEYRGWPLCAVTCGRRRPAFGPAGTGGRRRAGCRPSFLAEHSSIPRRTKKRPSQPALNLDARSREAACPTLTCVSFGTPFYWTLLETERLLQHVRDCQAQPFLCPMVCLAAPREHGGATFLPLRVDDVDFASETVLLPDKKGARVRADRKALVRTRITTSAELLGYSSDRRTRPQRLSAAQRPTFNSLGPDRWNP
jgi:hypothetical protein